MKPPSHQFRHEEKQEALSAQTQEQKAETKSFSSVDELLRHDAAQIQVPLSVAKKLNKSISREPQPSASWWRRLFGQS